MSELHDELAPLLAGLAAIGMGVSLSATFTLTLTPLEPDDGLSPLRGEADLGGATNLRGVQVDPAGADGPARRGGDPIREAPIPPAQAEAAVVQLAQGIASGMLQGDELRAVLENDPGLARALCRGLATLPAFRADRRPNRLLGFDDLRRFASEGRLTTPVVVAALAAAAVPRE